MKDSKSFDSKLLSVPDDQLIAVCNVCNTAVHMAVASESLVVMVSDAEWLVMANVCK